MIEVEGATQPGQWLTRVVRGWWPVPVFVATAVLGQVLLLNARYDVAGHAGEHLASASAPFLAAAMLGVLFWATPGARRQVDALFAAALWLAATLVVMVGNLRVVDDLIAAGHGSTPTSDVPEVADHSLANAAPTYGVAAGLVLVAVYRWRRHVGNRALFGAILAMVFPPWLIPGAGVVVLTFVRCVGRARSHERGRL
jgi:hypothetical protein